MRRTSLEPVVFLACLLAACSDSSSNVPDAGDAGDAATLEDAGLDAADASADVDAVVEDGSVPDSGDPDAGTDRAFTFTFHGVLGEEAASCATTYEGFGPAQDQSFTLKDFRFYVHGVELLTASGEAVPVTLDEEAPFQRAGVALLDFEDKTGDCINGTEAMRNVVRGRAPMETYMGVRFVLGVPLAQNHQDRSVALAPLDLSQMFWSWAGGYIFARFDFYTTEVDGGPRATFAAHLGSTGCNGSPSSMPSTACTYPNRPVITLMDFDPDSDVIEVDAAALVTGVDLTFNTPSSGIGCMAGRSDPECAVVLPRFGLDFETTPGAQVLFRVAE